MIQEIVKFTENLIADIPEIMQQKVQLYKGLHVFIDIDDNGKWVNCNLIKGKDYDFYDGKDRNIPMWNDCVSYQEITDYITMNKVQKFDSKQKIHSCSPFAVAFNFNFNNADKTAYGIKIFKKTDRPTDEEKRQNEDDIRTKRIKIIKERLNDYERCSCSVFFGNENPFKKQISDFIKNIYSILDKVKDEPDFKNLTDKDYLRIYLRSFDFELEKKYYQEYVKREILNGEELSFDKNIGSIGFMTTFPSKKPFLRHRTSSQINGVNARFSRKDALILNNFEKMLRRNVLPNPLPIVIDDREVNKQIIKIFNEKLYPINYIDLIKRLFVQNNLRYLSDYYLLSYSKTMSGIVFNDFDFVPSFRYYLDETTVENVTSSGIPQKKIFEKDADVSIHTIFDFERIVVREIFNNSLIKIKEDKWSNVYFGGIDPKYVTGGDIMYNLIMKYRKAFYDFIYKSKSNAINSHMFDDVMYVSILSNIKYDKINGRVEWNNRIKRKINIWFSLYNLFNNNLNTKIMASKITDLLSKMRSVAAGASALEAPEEFSFGAGQLVSYLLDRSIASDKTYVLLEPYLQKTKSGLLQDAIAQTINVYKHDISTYKGAFQALASNVLTYDSALDLKPFLKYFLAGCFSPCVIYEKTINNKQ